MGYIGAIGIILAVGVVWDIMLNDADSIIAIINAIKTKKDDTTGNKG